MCDGRYLDVILLRMNKAERIISEFAISGNLVKIASNRQGHINSTFISTFNDGRKYTHQMINKNVFPHPEDVMENICAVTEHIRRKTGKENSALSVVPTRSGKPFYVDDEGMYWRTYVFVDNVISYDRVPDEKTAYNLGKGIGNFQSELSDFDSSVLNIVIPHFHDMRLRYKQLQDAMKKDTRNRLRYVQTEVSFLLDNKERGEQIWDAFEKGIVPSRVTHNDTKINNVLFSEETGEAACVIDLDTIMPGTILFDTGDMIRTACSTADEDERNTEKMKFSVPLYKALIKGYMESAGSFLTDEEKSLIKESGRTITQIMAVRFLTDYLAGDTYYKIAYEDHNLVRARTQIALMESMDSQWNEF